MQRANAVEIFKIKLVSFCISVDVVKRPLSCCRATATALNWRLSPPSTASRPPPSSHQLNHYHQTLPQKSTQNSFSNTFTPSSYTLSITIMLRRPPTTLTITAEDVAAYEDRRAGEALLAAQQAQQARAAAQAQAQQQQGNQGQASSSAMDGVQTSPSATRRARDERIGVSRRR